MLASYSLVPVTTILATANWSNPYMFVELENRAPHRLGGAEKVINDIEGRELQEEMRKNMETDDMLERTAKSGWKYFKEKLVK